MAKPEKPTLILAGPGAGKTWDMVRRIREAQPELAPWRYLAAITYTNAAADSILLRLGADGPVKRNVFVGTTHSFVNRFILLPFATLLDKLPADRIYGALNVRESPRVKENKTAQGQNAAAAAITAALLAKGVVPYDSMLKLAKEIIERPECRALVSQRLQYLFIDEFQDADTRQFVIFDEIRKAGQTKIFGIGDPEQYITGFSYALRRKTTPKFSAIPFFKFKDKSNCSELRTNRRSNQNLVDFLNQFRDDLTQKAEKPHRNAQRVVYLKETNLPGLCHTFRQVSNNVERTEDEISRLYLGFENKMFPDVSKELGLSPISSDHRLNQGILSQALDLLSLASGLSQSRLLIHSKLSRLQLRAIGMEVIALASANSSCWRQSSMAG